MSGLNHQSMRVGIINVADHLIRYTTDLVKTPIVNQNVFEFHNPPLKGWVFLCWLCGFFLCVRRSDPFFLQ